MFGEDGCAVGDDGVDKRLFRGSEWGCHGFGEPVVVRDYNLQVFLDESERKLCKLFSSGKGGANGNVM